MKLEFSEYILKNTKVSHSIKMRPVGAGEGWLDGRIDRQTDR